MADKITIFAIFIIFISSYLSADNTDFIVKQKRFIKELYKEKRYFDCIAETRKLMIFSPNSEDINEYNFFIDLNYYFGGQYKTVIYNITHMDENKKDLRNRILLSQAYLKLGLYSDGINVLKGLFYKDVDASFRYELFLRRSEAYLYNTEYKKIIEEIKSAQGFIQSSRLNELNEEMKRYNELGFRSTGLSMALSALIPGSGQIYSGKYVSGILSFISVVATATGAYFFYKNGEKGLSYTCIFFSSLFYVGNIYGAYNSAHMNNIELHKSFRMSISNKYIPTYNPSKDIIKKGIFN